MNDNSKQKNVSKGRCRKLCKNQHYRKTGKMLCLIIMSLLALGFVGCGKNSGNVPTGPYLTCIDPYIYFHPDEEPRASVLAITEKGIYQSVRTQQKGSQEKNTVLLHMNFQGEKIDLIPLEDLMRSTPNYPEGAVPKINHTEWGQLFVTYEKSSSITGVQMLDDTGRPKGSPVEIEAILEEGYDSGRHQKIDVDSSGNIIAYGEIRGGINGEVSGAVTIIDIFDPSGELLFRARDNSSTEKDLDKHWTFLDMIFTDKDITYVTAKYPEGHVLLPVNMEKRCLDEPIHYARNLQTVSYRNGKVYFPNDNGIYRFNLEGIREAEILLWSDVDLKAHQETVSFIALSDDLMYINPIYQVEAYPCYMWSRGDAPPPVEER